MITTSPRSYDEDEISINTQLPEYASCRLSLASTSRPPTYVADGASVWTARPRDANRSSYYPSSTLGTPYEYTLQKKGKDPWLTWKITDPRKDSCSKPPNVATFVGGENVRGSVQLSLDDSVKVTTISLRLTGTIFTTNMITSVPTFVDITHQVYPPKGGGADLVKELKGDYEIEFDFPFPEMVDVSPITPQVKKKGMPEVLQSITCNTPPSLHERNAKATVIYTLILNVGRGKFHSDSSLKTPVVFIPNTYPPEPSVKRRRAIEKGIRAPLPRDDPYGWFDLPQVRVIGLSPSDQMPFEVIYDLSVAAPGAYTRGTTISCVLNIRANNPSLLQQIAKPEDQRVRLSKKVDIVENYFHEDIANYLGSPISKSCREEVGRCFFTPRDEEELDIMIEREGWASVQLEGEIYISDGLVPTFYFASMSVGYLVELLPCAGSAFLSYSFGVESGTTSDLPEPGPQRNPSQPGQALRGSTVLTSFPVAIMTRPSPGVSTPLASPGSPLITPFECREKSLPTILEKNMPKGWSADSKVDYESVVDDDHESSIYY